MKTINLNEIAKERELININVARFNNISFDIYRIYENDIKKYLIVKTNQHCENVDYRILNKTQYDALEEDAYNNLVFWQSINKHFTDEEGE